MQLHEVVDDWTKIRNEWILIKNGQAKSYHFALRIYSGQELRDRLGQVGFADIKLYGSFTGTPYDAKAERLVAIARRT